mmetsp:Transcript_61435/g.99342  ORF Transcript_61435/g.99342 Transcript_61435/m.99342 type:complete len:84 (+) Transcript_61435:27-278(+)
MQALLCLCIENNRKLRDPHPSAADAFQWWSTVGNEDRTGKSADQYAHRSVHGGECGMCQDAYVVPCQVAASGSHRRKTSSTVR